MRPALTRALEALRRGDLIGLPTETVYGLGADASNELAVRRIFAVKGRPSTHPLIVHVADLPEARRWASTFSAHAEALAAAFWPGPLTLIVPRSDRPSDAVTGGQNTVGLRVPDHPLALELLREFAGGIAAPSANRYGRVSPTTAQHVRDELGSDVAEVLDGGPCTVGVESTIVDLSGVAPRLLRPGGVPLEAIEAALHARVPLATAATDIRAPGMVASHYAPRAGLVLATRDSLEKEVTKRLAAGARVAVLAPSSEQPPTGAIHLAIPDDAEGYARALYGLLREADARGCDVIVAIRPTDSGLGLAVNDRLTRAATPRRT
ncbi:MAG: threonylcarbamoyl-AMP synthase [Archangium sp.]|nr:threonylcarbamoyl-AMP synthase [Archangium sp.]